MEFKLLVLLYMMIGSTTCIYEYFSEHPSSVPLLHGLLSDSMFSYEPRTLENGLFPANINVHVEFLGYQHNFSLYQIQGLAKTSSLNSKVLIINNSNSEINEANSENQNLNYQLYYDEVNEIFATLVNNTDLIKMGFNTSGYDYRILMSIMINGTQVNFKPAILGYQNVESYQHYYSVQGNIAGSDLNDSFATQTVSHPCDSSPCQNNGICEIDLVGNYACLCPDNKKGPHCEYDQDSITTTRFCPDCNGYVPATRPQGPCGSKPCQNGGNCKTSLDRTFFTCFCTSKYTGRFCEKNRTISYSESGLSIEKALKRSPTIEKIISRNNVKRTKRDVSYTLNQNLFIIDTLIVIDDSVYQFFNNLYGNLNHSLLLNYINIFFCYLINGINQRFYNSLVNDPDIMITVSLTNVLILNDTALTPWTNPNLVGVPGLKNYKNYPPALLANSSIFYFENTMSKMNLTFDYCIGVINLDLWGNIGTTPEERHSVVGYTSRIPSICSSMKYTLLEFNGFNKIVNGAHELGHVLGAVHDGTIFNNVDATQCPYSANNIMTPFYGASQNAKNLFFFSSCSISSFKSTLLSEDRRNRTKNGQCFSSGVDRLLTQFQNVYSNNRLPGKVYSADDQCKLIYGPISHYCNGSYNGPYGFSNNDLNICQQLFCYPKNITNGVCTTGGVGIGGIGALDGTQCYTNAGKVDGMICYQGRCVNQAAVNVTFNNKNCNPNPCLHGGQCIPNSLNSNFTCNCTAGYSGFICQNILLSTTTSAPISINFDVNKVSTNLVPQISTTQIIAANVPVNKNRNLCKQR